MDIKILREIFSKDLQKLQTQDNEIIEEAIDTYLSISNNLSEEDKKKLDKVIMVLSENDD